MRILPIINLSLATLIALSALSFFVFSRSEGENVAVERVATPKLPKNPFAQDDSAYEKIGKKSLALKWVAPKMLLPDLRGELLNYGKNGRPDLIQGKGALHLALKGSGESCRVEVGKKIYLVYEGSDTRPQIGGEKLWNQPEHNFSQGNYTFSPGNQPTPLWLTVKTLREKSAECEVSLLDETGTLVTAPQEAHAFVLPEKQFMKNGGGGWTLDGTRVDSTLLVRQRARWIGHDLFLSRHGGAEFAKAQGREKIVFHEHANPYAVFVKKGDYLVWKEKRWHTPEPGEDTTHLPLLAVTRQEDKVMGFELWDAEGKGKVAINLMRSREGQTPVKLDQHFKFVGAKTWAQFLVEHQGERMILRPNDWLVLTKEGWRKLDSPEMVDDFVAQKISGPLFVLDKMVKRQGQQVLVGHLFNNTRTESYDVELPASINSLIATAQPYRKPTPAPEPEDEFDDFDEDD